MIVLDTNVVSELMRPSPDDAVLEWIEGHPVGSLATTSVSVAEVRYGIARLADGRRRDALRAQADRVFDAFASSILAFDGAAGAVYGDLVAARERAGRPIGGFDAQIAAICRRHDAVLATRNTADFGGVGLTVTDPWCGLTG